MGESTESISNGESAVGRVPEVRRRRSPIDPPDGSWAVIVSGTECSVFLDALAEVGISAVGYDKNPSRDKKSATFGEQPNQIGRPRNPDHSGQSEASGPTGPIPRPEHSDEYEHLIRFNHIVVSVSEIDDIEGLAVTSMDRLTGEINTDYYAGIAVATEDAGCCGDLVESADTLCSPPPEVFTPHNPAIVLVDLHQIASDVAPEVTGNTGAESALGEQASFVATYARLLADSPRKALSFHRDVCAGTQSRLGLTTERCS